MDSEYNNKGMYNGYNRNNKDREEFDYYATPPQEVYNILRFEPLKEGQIILEPCVGQGAMIQGIDQHLKDNRLDTKVKVFGTDLVDRGYKDDRVVYGLDFLDDNYPFGTKADVIVMNPPYSLVEEFTLKALKRANKVILLARTQFAESKSRYENIFSINPPSRIYLYVDRIACYKNGDFSKKQSSSQSYSWFVFQSNRLEKNTEFYWLRRYDKI
ncbi:MAG: hypothetical protein HUJ68_03115 [Clostridia bacterium]|nr:hypothetical protein [Clostridia bacterium]